MSFLRVSFFARAIAFLSMTLFVCYSSAFAMYNTDSDRIDLVYNPDRALIIHNGTAYETDYETYNLENLAYRVVSNTNGSFSCMKYGANLFSGQFEKVGTNTFALTLTRNGDDYVTLFELYGTQYTVVSGAEDLADFYASLGSADISALEDLQQELDRATMLMVMANDSKADGISYGCGWSLAMQGLSLVALAVACAGTAGIGCAIAIGLHWGGIVSIGFSCQ